MLFIVGFPRSGTKLIRQAINTCEEISIIPVETEFLLQLNSLIERENRNISSDSLISFIKATPFYFFLKDETSLTIDESYIEANLVKCTSLSSIFELIIRSILGEDEKYVGDKSPSYLNILQFIVTEFKSSKIILVIRDPLDVCQSNYRAWNKSRVRCAFKWKMAHKNIPKYKNFLHVKYESFVSNPNELMEEITKFLEVTIDSEWQAKLGIVENLGSTKGQAGVIDNSNKVKNYNLMYKILSSIVYDEASELGYDYKKYYGNSIICIFRVMLPLLAILDILNLFIFDIKKMGFVNGIKFRISYFRNMARR